MLKKILLRGLICFSGAALVTANAAGADDKVSNGGICHQLSTTGTLVRSAGTVYNDSTSGVLAVTCPVVRDNFTATIPANQISFDVFDRSSVGDVTCQFINEIGTASGLGAAEVDTATSTGNSAGIKNIVIPTQSTSLGATQWSHVYCALPAKVSGSNPSHVARIWMSEP
jgi:hypothetical protein